MYVMNENVLTSYVGLFILIGVLIALCYVAKQFMVQAKRLRDDHMKKVELWGACHDVEMEKMKALSDVCSHLIPLMTEMNINCVAKEGRVARLDKKKWSKQFELGVNRACGFDIEWFDEVPSDMRECKD